MKRKGRKSAAQTPAPPKERVYGSKKNPVGSAASKTSASSIVLSTSALKTLKDKKDKFNKENPSKKVGLPALKAVMRRGMGAYSKSHRPTITGGVPNSRQAWGFARVNKFLKKKSGEKVKAAYVQDDDLLEKGGEIKLLAPNGKKSNLTPEQYKLVRTPEFKAWFGDWENDPKNASKVVDENGEPLVVYHFSDIDFNIFELKGTSIGFFFVEDKYDDEFSAEGVIKSLDKGIVPRWLQKYRVTEEEIREGLKESKYKVSKPYFLRIKKLNKSVVPDIYWSTPTFENPRILQSKYDNYDGIEFINEVDEKRIIVAFEPNQIKLADGTNTTFDANNPDIRYEDGGFLQSIYEGMDNLIKNGIVLTDKSKSVSVIAYNTGNQERDKSLYNKALIYYSVKPLRQANEIIENFDNEEYSLFDVKKIEEYKNAPHLIILNQNEVVYDSNNPDIRYKEGGNTKQMFIHWTDKNGLKNILSENTLFEETSLTDSLKLPFDIDNNLPFGIVFKDNIYKELYKIDEEQAGTLLEIEHEYRTKKEIIFDTYFDGFVVRNQTNRKKLENYLENSQDFWQNDNLRKYYKEKGYNIRKAESPNKYKLGGEMKHEIALPDTYASYDRLKDILENQGYELQKKGNELPVGKLAKGMTLSEVAAIHGLKADDLKSELKLGIETEKEHTDIAEYARAIALDHLYEDPKYYTKLKKMEKSYKDGGEIAHISGKAGGVLVGRRHSEGGIKAVNKSNNQPLEMEGGEVVITRNAVSDSTKREFEGEMLTNREILSRINQSGGGVAFADGGEVEPKCACKGNKYKWGGKMVSDYDIVNQINNLYEIPKKVVEKPFDMTGVRYADMKPSEALKKLFGYSSYAKGGMANEKGDSVFLGSKYLPSMKGFVKMMKAVQSPFEGDNATYIPKRVHYDVRFFRDGGINAEEITKAEAYKTFLFDEYGIKFKDLPAKIQNALMIGNQQLIDNYINQ